MFKQNTRTTIGSGKQTVLDPLHNSVLENIQEGLKTEEVKPGKLS